MGMKQELTIDRTLLLKAPIQKVWNAIGTPEGFAGWFLAKVEGDWKVGETVTLLWPSGNANDIILSTIDEPVAFAYRWHPGDYAKLADFPFDQLTTVTMTLKETEGGTELHLTETGFENLSDDRRAKVLGLNTEGWDEELENIRKYVEE
jgi:uncharacterized protein YndB with AHSA1/START domain